MFDCPNNPGTCIFCPLDTMTTPSHFRYSTTFLCARNSRRLCDFIDNEEYDDRYIFAAYNDCLYWETKFRYYDEFFNNNFYYCFYESENQRDDKLLEDRDKLYTDIANMVELPRYSNTYILALIRKIKDAEENRDQIEQDGIDDMKRQEREDGKDGYAKYYWRCAPSVFGRWPEFRQNIDDEDDPSREQILCDIIRLHGHLSFRCDTSSSESDDDEDEYVSENEDKKKIKVDKEKAKADKKKKNEPTKKELEAQPFYYILNKALNKHEDFNPDDCRVPSCLDLNFYSTFYRDCDYLDDMDDALCLLLHDLLEKYREHFFLKSSSDSSASDSD